MVAIILQRRTPPSDESTVQRVVLAKRLTCPPTPGRPAAVHTLTWATWCKPNCQHSGLHPDGGHEPTDSQSAKYKKKQWRQISKLVVNSLCTSMTSAVDNVWRAIRTRTAHISDIDIENIDKTINEAGRGGGWVGRATHASKDVSSTHRDAFPLLRALSEKESLVAISALHPQEAVGGVSNSRRQNFVTQHSVNHRALPVTCPTKGDKTHCCFLFCFVFSSTSFL